MNPRVACALEVVLPALLILNVTGGWVFPAVLAGGPPVWSLSVDPMSRTVQAGGSTTYTVHITGSSGGIPIKLEFMYPGRSATFIKASFSLNNRPAPYTSTLSVAVKSDAHSSHNEFPVYAEKVGTNEHQSVTVTLYIQAASAGFDFTMTLSPASQSVKAGEIANFQILITYSDPSHSGTTITVQGVTGLGPGMNYQIIPSPAGLRISTSQSTPTGTYTITLVGSAMGVMRQASASLTVQTAEQPFDFSISASPTPQTITPGGSATCTVTVTLLSGTSQNVALTVSGAPDGVSTSLNPTSGTPSFNSILSISTTSSAASGQYLLTITGSAGTKTHATTITLTIGQSPDFRVEVNPPSQISTQGQTTSYAVSVVGLNGFNSQVSLNVAGLPVGVGGVLSVPSSIPDYSSTLSVTIPSSSPTGSFTLTITGSGGGIMRTANVILTINPSQAQTQSSQTTTSGPSAASSLLDALQQNSVIIIAALAFLVILFGTLAMRARGRHAAPQQKGAPRIFCGRCGTQNPTSNKFCATCGQKLKGS